MQAHKPAAAGVARPVGWTRDEAIEQHRHLEN
jgi:hypothetical protein